ncbi:MAG: hypothetical protein WBD28_00255, partial [Candidatus Zixiibacteriota bacterium]
MIIPEKTAIEIIKAQGDKAIKIKDRTKATIHAHTLHDLGVQGLREGDYTAYNQAVWQMLRLHELCVTADWIDDYTTQEVRTEVRKQLVSLIVVNPLPWSQKNDLSRKLAHVALVGTE